MSGASPSAIIGIWDGHDAGAALVIDGRVVLALNEERLSGRKLEVGFPSLALAKVREAAGEQPITWAVTTSDPAKTLTRLIPSSKERYYRQRRRLEPPEAAEALRVAAAHTGTDSLTINSTDYNLHRRKPASPHFL
jgi:carbamoyltransferase